MKITYLYNSGFKIETDDKIIIFDAMTDPKIDHTNKKLYFFITHSHADHYNKIIFDYNSPDTKYILSDDIKYKNEDNIIYIKPYDEITIDDISVKAFGSTDRGVSFLLKVDDKLIFHSGDLNWWHWANNDEATNKTEADDYKAEILKLKDFLSGDIVDISFIPVDARLGSAAGYALSYYLSEIKTITVFPMHFAGDLSYLTELDKIIAHYNTINILKLTKREEAFEINV